MNTKRHKAVQQIAFRFSLFFFLTFLLWACAVPQWKREHLSDPIMLMDGDTDTRWMKEHILKNREGTSGGYGEAGGGCGC